MRTMLMAAAAALMVATAFLASYVNTIVSATVNVLTIITGEK